MLVPRRTGTADGLAEVEIQHLGVSKSTSSAGRRLVKKTKPIPPALGLTAEGDDAPDSLPPLSRCSSATGSNPGSDGISPIMESMSLNPLDWTQTFPLRRRWGQ